MRGGGTRTTVVRKTASSRRRRDRYTRDSARDPWGAKRELTTNEDDWDDSEVDTAC